MNSSYIYVNIVSLVNVRMWFLVAGTKKKKKITKTIIYTYILYARNETRYVSKHLSIVEHFKFSDGLLVVTRGLRRCYTSQTQVSFFFFFYLNNY